jgi:hypothetical protein
MSVLSSKHISLQLSLYHAEAHMSMEYYGAPREAGSYIGSAISSSLDEEASYSDSTVQYYFDSYKNESSYPSFLTNYEDIDTSHSEPSQSSSSSMKF